MIKIKNAVLETIHSLLIVVLILWVIVVVIVLHQGFRTRFATIPTVSSVSELRENVGRTVEINAPVIEPTGTSYTYRARRGGLRRDIFPTTAHLHALIFEDGAVAFRTTIENFNAGESIIVRVRNRAYDRVGDALLTREGRRHGGRRGYLLRRSGAVRTLYGRIIVHRAGTIDDSMPYLAMLALAGLIAGGLLLLVRKKRL